MAGSGSPSAEGWGAEREGWGAERKTAQTGHRRNVLVLLVALLLTLNGNATIPGNTGRGDIQVKAFWSKKGIPDDIVSGCCRQMLLSDLERHVRCQ